jgi:hypothetical protein
LEVNKHRQHRKIVLKMNEERWNVEPRVDSDAQKRVFSTHIDKEGKSLETVFQHFSSVFN